MSILNRPYEISVWEDVLENGEFQEKRIGVIGSNEMTFQGRAINPQFGRNVNGVKSFSFDMYHYYIDNITGEKIKNPFSEWLISERKIKLKYKGKWHDFVIKDITEKSSDYLYNYKLEDAMVVELSKNGFGVVLDEKENNNLGSPETLAVKALKDTDWKVESEVFVQKVEDALVRVSIPRGTQVVHLLDQKKNELSEGVQEVPYTISSDEDTIDILAFYSSCTTKPHRFQFIYLDDLTKITTDKEGKINNVDCQYYIEFEPSGYKEVTNTPFFLPDGYKLSSTDSYLYTDARAERYDFVHQSRYEPKLDRYIYEYLNENGDQIYGYYDTEYFSPELIPNIIANTRFDSTKGWIGATTEENGKKTEIRNVYGYFDVDENHNTIFIDSADELLSGNFNPENEKLSAYLEITVEPTSLLLNSGPYDNRITIKNMPKDSLWKLEAEIYGVDGTQITQGINFEIGELDYDDETDIYNVTLNTDNIQIEQDETDSTIYKVIKNSYDEDSFKKDSEIYVCIKSTNSATYYIKSFHLFRLIRDDNGNIIYPDDIGTQAEQVSNGVSKNTYKYFTKDALEVATDTGDLKFESETEQLSYSTYKPVYNTGAEKIRPISAKESNYFNILQSIAETFGAWLEIDVEHEDDGAIKKDCKKIRFKNYIGKNNYANFRYGVNLKDIQRTYASKEIVTKLIVKPNSNEYGKNGYCAVGRANSNPSGEDYIYDFRYFFDKDLLSAKEYLEDVYVPTVYDSANTNIEEYYQNTNGYYDKIKTLNLRIQKINNEVIIPTQTRLAQLESEKAIAEAEYDATIEGIQEIRENFQKLTGISIDNISEKDIKAIEISSTNTYSKTEVEERYGNIWYIESAVTPYTVTVSPLLYSSGLYGIRIYVWVKTEATEDLIGDDFKIYLYPKIRLTSGFIYKVIEQNIKIEALEDFFVDVPIGKVIDTETSNLYGKIIDYTLLLDSKRTYEKQKAELSEKISDLQSTLEGNQTTLDELKENKRKLNLAFFKKYSRFIQEGTWIDEKYFDDELYYADALSVMYNSCFPKVAYTINVLALSVLPDYENFVFELGDTTYAEDQEFFDDGKEEVSITEIIEFLDEPDKDTIKVQNFKNQFQDLFQKITATVQQTQYSTGSYEKAVALAEANQERKQQFLSDALSGASARLSAAGQQSVVWDNTGITITDINTPSNQIKMIGGVILLRGQDKNGKEKWTTGITSDGISASLITAGILNAGEIAIMNADEPVFRWDAFGISAFDFIAQESDFGTIIGAINPNKFVRFDKYGIYGIDDQVDGLNWHATSIDEINNKATFALTWDGLKVTGANGGVARLGKQNDRIFSVKNNDQKETFSIDENGNITMSGNFSGGFSGQIGGKDTSQLVMKEELTKLADNLQNQIDGNITTYFLPYLPDVNKYPVTQDEYGDGWGKKYLEHNGDLFYITSPTGGQVYVQLLEPDKNVVEIGDYWVTTEFNDDEGYSITVKKRVKENNRLKWVALDPDNDEEEISIVLKVGHCYRWQYQHEDNSQNPQDSDWAIVNDTAVAESLLRAEESYGLAESKNKIFVGEPEPPYVEGDFWVVTDDTEYTIDGETRSFKGEILRCKRDNYTSDFRHVDWTLASKYTDDSALNEFLNSDYRDTLDRIDGKARSWYQEEDPSIDWDDSENHEGDLWYNSDDQETYIYKDGKWEKTSAPKEVFDKIDGIASIYTTIPDSPIENDILIPASDSGIYKTGKIYKYQKIENTSNFEWKEVSYTDDSVANSKLDPSVNGNYSWDFNENHGIMLWSGNKKVDDNNSADYGNWDTENNMVFKIGQDSNGDKYLKLRGTVYAQDGEIGGWNISNTGLSKNGIGIYSDNNGQYFYAGPGTAIETKTLRWGDFFDAGKYTSFKFEWHTLSNYMYITQIEVYYFLNSIRHDVTIKDHKLNGQYLIVYFDEITLESQIYINFEITGPKSTNSLNFKVDNQGYLQSSYGNIGGWDISSNILSSNFETSNPDHEDRIVIGNKDFSSNIFFGKGTEMESERKDWRLLVGNCFGVTKGGELYSASGNIGNFLISDAGFVRTFTKTRDSGIIVLYFIVLNETGISCGYVVESADWEIHEQGRWVFSYYGLLVESPSSNVYRGFTPGYEDFVVVDEQRVYWRDLGQKEAFELFLATKLTFK